MAFEGDDSWSVDEMTYYMYYDKAANTFHIFWTKQKVEPGLAHRFKNRKDLLDFVFSESTYAESHKVKVGA